jgi:hypothetical protein
MSGRSIVEQLAARSPDCLTAAGALISLRSAWCATQPPRNHPVSREYEPAVGQWYENIDENESFRVLSVDEDAELVELEYLDGDIEEIDLETWHELDLEKITEPEGWAGSAEDEEEEEEEKDEKDDLDETWDDDEDEDDDDWDEEEKESDNY